MKRLMALAACIALAACGTKDQQKPEQQKPAMQPTPGPGAATAPDSFRVSMVTSRGPVTIEVYRAWSPHGADRFYQLVSIGYFTDVRFFRVVPGFVAQFGMNGDPKLNSIWKSRPIPDDSVKTTNARGTLVFAAESTPNSRTNQLFFNLVDNPRLDHMGFSPIGRVVDGLPAVEALYSGYGEAPDQGMIGAQGNDYLNRMFPKLDYIKSATIVSGAPSTSAAQKP